MRAESVLEEYRVLKGVMYPLWAQTVLTPTTEHAITAKAVRFIPNSSLGRG
jgi:hypothetical protein